MHGSPDTDHHARIPHATRIERARVLVVGAGGLGCPASLALAQGGVGHLTLVDPDRVDVTNLPRQLWHRTGDVGRSKAESAAAGLLRAFPGLSVEALPERLDAGNAEGLFRAHDLVVDGTDGVATKFFLSDVAVLTGVPLVYGGVLRMQGRPCASTPEAHACGVSMRMSRLRTRCPRARKRACWARWRGSSARCRRCSRWSCLLAPRAGPAARPRCTCSTVRRWRGAP